MLEHDANELMQYFHEQIRPNYRNVLDPRTFLHPTTGLDDAEAHIVIPVTEEETARRIFSRIVSEMGNAGQISIPNNRSEISCILQTMHASELPQKLQHNGLLWILTLNSQPLITLPDRAPTFDIYELFTSAEPDEGDDYQPYDFGHTYQDSSAYVSTTNRSQGDGSGTKDATIMSFSVEITQRLCEYESDCLITPWRSECGPNGSNVNFIAVHGFSSHFEAARFAQDVVDSVPRVISVSLMDLKMPGIEYGRKWKNRYLVRFAEMSPR